MNYYNDNDKNACKWLKELIADGLIPPGDVDDRSIIEIQSDEIRHYHQCHFFAGIGGWSLALQLAGWDGPCWTGSVPCQPLSCAGQGKGHADERHLWPAFYTLIAECRPPTVFGEQVASKLGREWFAGVRADLEGTGYACGAANLPACSVGAPHRRERLFWVGHAMRSSGQRDKAEQAKCAESRRTVGVPGASGERVADAQREGSQGTGEGRQAIQGRETTNGHGRPSGRANFWDSAASILCRDGKARRVEPSIPPLAHGIPGRVALLRGAGNAIVPQVAAEFVITYMETRNG